MSPHWFWCACSQLSASRRDFPQTPPEWLSVPVRVLLKRHRKGVRPQFSPMHEHAKSAQTQAAQGSCLPPRLHGSTGQLLTPVVVDHPMPSAHILIHFAR